MKIKLKFLFILWSCFLHSQSVITVTSIPKNTPEDANIYMASSLNQWNPKDENFRLKKNENGNYFIQISDAWLKENPNIIEYKFTLGSWDNAEGDANGNQIQNRFFKIDEQKNIENSILTWQKVEPKKNTASKNVGVLSESFYIPQLKTTRKIWIYLPSDYQKNQKKYPVIYMEDGQNLFNDATSFSGEWHIDESLNALEPNKNKSAIVIAIENGGAERLNEYTPWKNAKYGGGKGDAYADFLANTLKPYVDKHYRTLTEAKNNVLIGSSLGGLISFYTGLKYPNKFGKLGIFSPSFWFTKDALIDFVKTNSKNISKTKFYFVAGTKESDEMITDIKQMMPLLYKKGVPNKNIKYKFDEDGTHSEIYWSREFPEAFLWLLP